MRTNVGLAAVLSLGLMAGSASAQNNESRGYGGPLYVGPNFQGGGQYSTPDFSKKAGKTGKKSVTIKRETAKARKPQKREVATEKETVPTAEKETTAAKTDTGASTSTTTGTAASSEPVTCKKFDPTSGQTITVPCR